MLNSIVLLTHFIQGVSHGYINIDMLVPDESPGSREHFPLFPITLLLSNYLVDEVGCL